MEQSGVYRAVHCPVAVLPGQFPSDAQRYIRFRAADAAGDMGAASAQMQVLLANDKGSVTLAQRACTAVLAAPAPLGAVPWAANAGFLREVPLHSVCGHTDKE